MRAALPISVLLNLGLAGGLIFVWTEYCRTEKSPAAPVAVAADSLKALAPVAPEVSPTKSEPEPAAVKQPFRWSQLRGGDYLTYVSNLRSAGCPETTVEDIVRGNAERAFDARRQQLGVDGNQSGPWSFEAQTQFVAYALGEKLPATEPAVQIAADIPPRFSPLVLQDVDLNALGLSEDQKAAVAWIKQQFLDDIGGPNQDQ